MTVCWRAAWAVFGVGACLVAVVGCDVEGVAPMCSDRSVACIVTPVSGDSAASEDGPVTAVDAADGESLGEEPGTPDDAARDDAESTSDAGP